MRSKPGDMGLCRQHSRLLPALPPPSPRHLPRLRLQEDIPPLFCVSSLHFKGLTLFRMFFLPFIFLYVVCDTLPILYDVAKRAGLPDDHVFQVLVSNLLTISYRTITPIVIAFLVERLYATVNCGTYEGSRPGIFPLLLPLGASLAIFDDFLLFYEVITTGTENRTLLAVEIFILIVSQGNISEVD